MKILVQKFLKIFLTVPYSNIPDLSSIKNILIVRQHNQLGDMLQSVSLLRALKENIPNAKITLVASPQNKDGVVQNKFIDNLVVFDKKKIFSLQYLKYLHSHLRKVKFEIGFVPTTVAISFTSGLILRFANCKYRVGPKSLDGKINLADYLFNYAVELDWRKQSNIHIAKRILKILEPLNIKTDDLSTHIQLTEEDIKFAEKFFEGINKKKIGFHIGAAKINNRWAVENFAKLLNELKSKFDFFYYLTLSNYDLELFNELKNKLTFQPKVLLNETIPRVAAVINESDLFISNDTGILHVAGSTKTPVIGLFGPTDPVVWMPTGSNKYFIRKEENINSISVSDVLQKIEEVLNVR